MKFDDLHATIPYAKGGKEKVLRYSPYPNVVLAMPGRHALDTAPIGGDFVVMVTDPVFKTAEHQFKHQDLFQDIQYKTDYNQDTARVIIDAYREVISGTDPDVFTPVDSLDTVGISPMTLLYSVQCLAVAEHRRYAKFQAKGGGKYLPLRYSEGIVNKHWTALEATGVQKMGRPGCEMLERKAGVKWEMPK